MSVHAVALFAFEGFQLLDVTGPATVFGLANTLSGRDHYKILIVSPTGGVTPSTCGVAVATLAVSEVRPRDIDTLLVSGGGAEAMRRAAAHPQARQWIADCVHGADRFGSVCSGAFVLAELGLLHQARVATHWADCDSLAERYPDITVDENSLFVVQGRLWTSAGVSTGIDMALAMVEQDIDRSIADRIAKFLVLYSRRPGYQSQFSDLLKSQTSTTTEFRDLVAWMQERLAQPLDIPALIARTGLSERTFYRKFLRATGQTPAKFVENLRLDAVRSLLATPLPLKTIAARTGMGTSARLTEAFERRFGITPTIFRQLHRGGSEAPQ
jgi:transcriptional regulator GlxA family with amidase domain